MQRYFLKLAYNGTAYHGWQIQPNAISVQAVLEDALAKLLHHSIALTGCGRTDAGVHARVFYAHFNTSAIFDETVLVQRINRFVGNDIVIYRCFRVPPDLHARFSALYRTYHYYITTEKNPFLLNFSYQIFRAIDFEKMNLAAAMLLKYTDFSTFCKAHTQTLTNNCKITECIWERGDKDHLWVFKITADRFLRNMVRAIVGTLLEVGYGKISLAAFREIVESKNRCEAGASMPASALFLHDVGYEWSNGIGKI